MKPNNRYDDLIKKFLVTLCFQIFFLSEQIKNREELEIKQVKAAHLRHEAIVTSTLFNQAHAAHHRKFVSESRQKDNFSQLKRQMQNEKIKNGTQISKVLVVML